MVSGVKCFKINKKLPLKKQIYKAKRSENMGESEGIKEILNQMAVQAATTVMMAFRHMGAAP